MILRGVGMSDKYYPQEYLLISSPLSVSRQQVPVSTLRKLHSVHEPTKWQIADRSEVASKHILLDLLRVHLVKMIDESIVDKLKILPSKVLGKVPNLTFTVSIDDVRDVLLNHLDLLFLVLSL